MEVVVTIGVAMIIIGSLVTLMNASNRRSTLARQATQASKLAQEGMEIVRNIRDVGAASVVRDVGTSTANPGCTAGVPSYCSFGDLYTANQNDPTPACLSLDAVTNQWRLLQTTDLACEGTLLGIFTREVRIEDNGIDVDGSGVIDADEGVCAKGGVVALTWGKAKRVTVIVGWNSPIGLQERSATTCLTRWRE